MIHISHKHQMVGVPYREDVANLFPHAVRARGLLALPHRFNETRMLRNLGLDVPAPITQHYDWAKGRPFDVQVKTAAMLTTNQRAYVLNGMGCVDADTEYLSPTGWVRIADYSGGEVAQYWPDRGEIEFVAPNQFVKLPCQEMIRFKTTRGVDQLLSPEHRVLLADGRVMQAEDIEAAYGSRQSRGFAFRTTFGVAGRPGVALSDAQIRVQVAVNADGYCAPGWTKTVIRVKKPRKIERLRWLLEAAGLPYREVPCAPEGFVRFSFTPPATKGFGACWWGATGAQLEVIADELPHWDGSARKAGGVSFSSFSRADADFAQYAFSAAGRRASLTARHNRKGTEYVVHVSTGASNVGLYGVNAGVAARNVWREKSPDGFKYCFMVPSTFLLLRRNGCVFATGNTGKTKAALWSYDYLRGNGEAKRALVVAPLSTLNFVWAREVLATTPHRRCQVLYGSRERRLKLLGDMDADLYIINPDGVKVIADELAKRSDIDTLIIDELATFRNGGAERTRLMRKLAQRMTWVWGLTGSPTPNEPTDAWAQCTIVTPTSVPKAFTRFRDDVMVKLTQFKFVPKRDAIDVVHRVMQPAVRFTLDDVVELPELVERQIDIELGDKQARVYKEMKDKAYSMIAAQEVTAMNAGAVLNKLLQISAGWVYTRDRETVALDNGARLQALVDAIEATDRKVIVFVPFVHALEGIADRLTKEGVDHAIVSGAVAKGARDQIFNKFQNTSGTRVLVAHPACMSHGLTLTAADTIIWFSPTTSLETFEQANARIRRVGQKHKQQILMFQSTKAERHVYARLRQKQGVQTALLDLFAADTASAAA